MSVDTLAFVSAAGGVGTTRLALECGTLLADDGRDVAVFDAAYGTQGPADHTPGRIDPDMTELCLGDAPLEQGLVDRSPAGPGRLAVCPARAPFERIARAKAPEAAEALEWRIAGTANSFDHVLVDTSLLAANQAVAAASTVERVAPVCDADRAAAAVPRTIDRLSDVGVDDPVAVVTRTGDHPDADATVPEFDADVPAVEAETDAADAAAGVLQEALDVAVDREEQGWLRSRL